MDKDCNGIKFKKFLDSVAVVYGVHSQLTKHEGVHIPEFDDLVEDMKRFLEGQGIGFLELVSQDDFLQTTGRARICSHALYPDLESVFGVKLPGHTPLDVDFCKEISIIEAIEDVRSFIY